MCIYLYFLPLEQKPGSKTLNLFRRHRVFINISLFLFNAQHKSCTYQIYSRTRRAYVFFFILLRSEVMIVFDVYWHFGEKYSFFRWGFRNTEYKYLFQLQVYFYMGNTCTVRQLFELIYVRYADLSRLYSTLFLVTFYAVSLSLVTAHALFNEIVREFSITYFSLTS